LFNVVYSRIAPVGSGAPLYFVLDEAPRLKDRIHYEEVLSIVRGAGVGVCLAAQDVSQFGDSRAQNAILSNCLTFISLRGASADTARYFSSRLGQRNERSLMLTRNRGPFQILSQRASNAQLVTLPVLAEREIMHPPGPPYSGLVQVVSVSAKPFLVDFARTT
ncbi:MAG: TraM recognition domain-containing protein, partial [Thiohalocapsa sp.]|nr:TraM recognition domain-containing protein [Thiohalocapsa sp.]